MADRSITNPTPLCNAMSLPFYDKIRQSPGTLLWYEKTMPGRAGWLGTTSIRNNNPMLTCGERRLCADDLGQSCQCDYGAFGAGRSVPVKCRICRSVSRTATQAPLSNSFYSAQQGKRRTLPAVHILAARSHSERIRICIPNGPHVLRGPVLHQGNESGPRKGLLFSALLPHAPGSASAERMNLWQQRCAWHESRASAVCVTRNGFLPQDSHEPHFAPEK